MSFDFSLTAYRQLLFAVKHAGYAFFTFEDWCDGKAQGRYVILRHDVDLKAENSLAIARIEAEMDIRATYYFRIVPQSNQPDIIRLIAGLGHEIGYHYEDLSLFKGDAEGSIVHFKKQLQYFRQFYPVRTICMHGSPTSKWDNRNLWKTYNYHDYEIIGEPYFDFINNNSELNPEIFYFTDTARMWDGDKYNVRDKMNTDSSSIKSVKRAVFRVHSTFDFVNWLKSKPTTDVIMITTHPQRWSNNTVGWIHELIMQTIKNFVKYWLFIAKN